MRKGIIAAVVAVALLAPSIATAHMQQVKGSYSHRLQVRIAHDRGVIKSVDKQAVRSGSWLFLTNELWQTREAHERDLAKAEAAYVATLRPAHYTGWLCIHRYEGSWADSGDPYWGGLQMDRGFMTTYGSDMISRYGGYANVWPPLVQMVVAERAYASGRGFGPWPNTARHCGLL